MIHETAIVHPTAEVADGVEIGPYSIIGEKVKIGKGTRIGALCVIDKWTVIGAGCQIFQHASLGAPPQHLRYKGEETSVIIGDNNIIREFVTIPQLVRIGTFAFVGGATALTRDIPPYVTASGMKVKFYGINVLNLQRNKVPEEVITGLRKAYKVLFRSHLTMKEAIKKVQEDPVFAVAEVQHMLDFIQG